MSGRVPHGEGGPTFRRARADERDLLDEMTLAGIRHWGHDRDHPETYQALVRSLRAEPGPEGNPVWVLEEKGQVRGFFELRDRGDHVELLRMFLDTDLIGTGYGRRLWEEAVMRARSIHSRMLIMSDPEARGFYEAMGAQQDGEVEVAPGFELGRYWYEVGETPT